ncbi:class I SAM-dependent methyltransferase [Carboxydochorda subterranea]|uniref:Class I SAM-dependent methyltransferase n=1 Tax=Carboxydichorda subterranea TaxID=3109565 RepID=A0ABZ1BVW3_9FIRM|nr:class I SAM-dependent methyltransferase [Limnochorda sp. L945t]WRP16814.1 class I SAM-dependent methyltransferase [Limnochorda sp. L945t]
MAWYEELFDETYLATYDPLLTAEYTSEQVDGLERLLELSPPADILDMPCGQGRHSIELARRGYRVTGVDLSAYLLDVARRRAEEAGLREEAVEWVRQDMRDFRRPQAFDVAINLFSSFGYLEDEAEDARVMAAFYESLRPGGRLVMEMIHKYWLIRSGSEQVWVETPGAFTLERVRYNVLTDRTETDRVVILDGGRVERRRFSIRQYSLVELARMAREVGFELAGAYGTLNGEEPLTLESRRLVAVFRRP